MKRLLLAGFTAFLLIGAAVPVEAQYYHRGRHHWHHWHRCWNCGPVYFGFPFIPHFYVYYPRFHMRYRPWGWRMHWYRW